MRLYFAGPLFSDAERAFNADLAAAIERVGSEVFLPQWDGGERDLPPYRRVWISCSARLIAGSA